MTTAAEPQSPVEDPLDFRNVRSGVNKAEEDAQCVPEGLSRQWRQPQTSRALWQPSPEEALRRPPRPCKTHGQLAHAPRRLHSPNQAQQPTPQAPERPQRSMRSWKGPVMSGMAPWRTKWRSGLRCNGEDPSDCPFQPTCSAVSNNTTTCSRIPSGPSFLTTANGDLQQRGSPAGDVPAVVLRCIQKTYGEWHYPAETSINVYAGLLSGFQPSQDVYRGPRG